MLELKVDLAERSYPIYIGRGILDRIGELFNQHQINQRSPLLVVTDEIVAKTHVESLLHVLKMNEYQVDICIVPSGESSKSFAQLEIIMTAALKAKLDRKSSIIAFGGGVVGDLAGFAAASFMRGIRFIQIPTTILAHDSSVGGKVAINHPLAKNMIGAFHQPEMVIFDISLLHTLPLRQIRSGLAEVIKHGLIWDATFVQWCDDHHEQLLSLHDEELQYALYQGCRIKSIVVSQDEREQGIRAFLNLGHTIGHALEAVSQYNELLHGEAISIGMVAAAKLSVRLGYSQHILETTERILLKYGLPVRIPSHLSTQQIIDAMMHDKKFQEGVMTFVLSTEIGKVEIRNDVSIEAVTEVIDELKKGA
jgi:3-dehydroquinate synthase